MAKYYTNGIINTIQDPGNLILQTLPSGIEICYSCTDRETDLNSAYTNCRLCGDNTFDEWNYRNSGQFETQSAAETHALSASVGCAVCSDGYFPAIVTHPALDYLHQRTCVERTDPEPKAGQMCTWSRVFEHDPNFNEETQNHDGSLVCSECENVVMGCAWCSSGKRCIECAAGAYTVSDLKSYNEEPACFYNFCGIDGDGVDHDMNRCISK